MSYDNRYGCLKLYPYCSLDSVELTGKVTPMDECRKAAASIIRRHRKELGYPVAILERGKEWELQSDPEGASLIGCNEGVMGIVDVVVDEDDDEWELEEIDILATWPCEDCGDEFDPDELTDGVCSECLDSYDNEDEEDDLSEFKDEMERLLDKDDF